MIFMTAAVAETLKRKIINGKIGTPDNACRIFPIKFQVTFCNLRVSKLLYLYSLLALPVVSFSVRW